MASMWKRAMLYLGLGPDDEYDDYAAAQEPPPERTRQVALEHRAEPPSGAVRTIARETETQIQAQPQPRPADAQVQTRQRTTGPTPVVRAITPTPAKVVTIAPGGFNDAQEIGDHYKAGQPVIVNTQGLDTDLRRRLVDFASGLCYGLGGQMDRVANQVYLLTPSNVEVSAEEKRRLQERGLYQA